MKKTLVLILLCFVSLATWSQDDPATQEQADKLNSLVKKLMLNQRYDEALTVKQREINILRQLRGENDSAYLQQKAFIGKIYHRLGKYEDAVAITQEAAEAYGEHVSNKDDLYAFLLDNVAFYLSAANHDDRAKDFCRKALTVYEQLGRQDADLAVILVHMAEICYGNGEPQEAIKYQLRALHIIKKCMGEHSDKYIDELAWLQQYYERAGDKKNAMKTEEQAKRLKDEKERGYEDLPEPIQFNTGEMAHEHNDDALRCIVYYLTHKLNAPNADQALRYIMLWSVASPDVNIVIGKKMTKLGATQESMPYLTAYIAATSYFCLTEKVSELDEPLFVKAVTALLQFYEPNRELTGNVDILDDYLKLQAKGKLEEQLHKDFLIEHQR